MALLETLGRSVLIRSPDLAFGANSELLLLLSVYGHFLTSELILWAFSQLILISQCQLVCLAKFT